MGRLFQAAELAGVRRDPPRPPNVPVIAEQPGTDPREGEQDRQGSQETRHCRRTHAEGGVGDPRQEVTRAGAQPWPGDLGEAAPELREHFISDPVPSSLFLCFLFSPVWQGVCAVSCPRNRQPVRSGPQQNRPSPLLPPSCLLPSHLPGQPPREVLYFSGDLGMAVPEPAAPVPCRHAPFTPQLGG